MIKKLADDDVKVKLACHCILLSMKSVPKSCPSVKLPLADLRESLEYWYRKKKSKISYEYVV
jgi:23S rRNA (adenine2503-C2)-methyltransferase